MQNSLYVPFLTKQELSLPFYVADIGNPKYQPPVYREAGIQHHQLLYTMSGAGICNIDEKEYTLEAGSLLFLPAHSAHCYYPKNEEWETLYITFHGSGFNNFFVHKKGICKLSKIDFESHYRNLYQLKSSNNYEKLSIKLYEFLIQLNGTFSENLSGLAKNKNKIDSALRIINSNNNYTVLDIAAELGITEEHFCRIFKQYMGYRPIEYINMLKLQKAKEMLSDKSLSIGQVAASAGFNDHSYFGKLFKRKFGVSPSEYTNNYIK